MKKFYLHVHVPTKVMCTEYRVPSTEYRRQYQLQSSFCRNMWTLSLLQANRESILGLKQKPDRCRLFKKVFRRSDKKEERQDADSNSVFLSSTRTIRNNHHFYYVCVYYCTIFIGVCKSLTSYQHILSVIPNLCNIFSKSQNCYYEGFDETRPFSHVVNRGNV